MNQVAERFKSIGQKAKASNTSSSIFGVSNLANAMERGNTVISFYPIINEGKPNVAMGVASCLAYLLEQYNYVKVYRVFARTDNDEDDEIQTNDYQFKIDDWEFEGLGDNVTLDGELILQDNIVKLLLNMEIISGENIDTQNLVFEYTDFVQLISNLSTIVLKVLDYIVEDSEMELIVTYNPDITLEASILFDILEDVFFWNLDLYLYLWGVDWEDEDIIQQFNTMLDYSKDNRSDFALWCICMMAKQVMQIGLDVIGDVIVPELDSIMVTDEGASIATATLSMSLIELGYITQAKEMIQNARLDKSTSLNLWFSAISVYLKANDLTKAIDINQRAIEQGLEDIRLYWLYHQLLNLADANDIFVEELVMIDPDDVNENEQLTYEIIASLIKVVEKNENASVLHTLLTYLIDVNHEKVWLYFEKLLNSDTPSSVIRDIVDRFFDIYDLTSAFQILESHHSKDPNNPDANLFLAQLYLLDGQIDKSNTYLDKVESLIDDDDNELVPELQRLRLSVHLEDFESKYADIRVILNANKNISEENVELLETAIEIAPRFADIYVTLARCYLLWNDVETAREVLNDATTNVGNHPRILGLQVHIEWKYGDAETAISILNDGIAKYPNDILLLSEMAQILISNEQLEDAKRYIERAESISSSHPEVWKLRRMIANLN